VFFGFAPAAPGFWTGGIKANGITNNGALVVGPFYAVDTPVSNKHNRTVTAFGDLTWAPTVWALISDPDLLDAPLNHFGYV
jgi:hypothetical protein